MGTRKTNKFRNTGKNLTPMGELQQFIGGKGKSNRKTHKTLSDYGNIRW